MTTGQTPAHARACLIVDPPEPSIPLDLLREVHRQHGTSMCAYLLGISRQAVLQRLNGRPRRKPTPRVTPEQEIRARLWAIALRLTALEIRVALAEIGR
jgi:hypothetical protein